MNEPFFHVGILVRDVEAARADFSAKLGLEFEPAHSQQLATGETTRFCYSLQGPPYLELVEMTGSGSWSPQQPEGFHHIGVSDPSVPARCAALGGRVDVIAPGDDGSPRGGWAPPAARRCTASASSTSTRRSRPSSWGTCAPVLLTAPPAARD